MTLTPQLSHNTTNPFLPPVEGSRELNLLELKKSQVFVKHQQQFFNSPNLASPGQHANYRFYVVKHTLLPDVTKASLCPLESKNRNAKCSFHEWGLGRRDWVARRRERRIFTWKLMCGCYHEHRSNCYRSKSFLKYITVAWNLRGSRTQPRKQIIFLKLTRILGSSTWHRQKHLFFPPWM